MLQRPTTNAANPSQLSETDLEPPLQHTDKDFQDRAAEQSSEEDIADIEDMSLQSPSEEAQHDPIEEGPQPADVSVHIAHINDQASTLQKQALCALGLSSDFTISPAWQAQESCHAAEAD